jgi:hypothetical protein
VSDNRPTDLVVSNTALGTFPVTLVATPSTSESASANAVHGQQEAQRDLAVETKAAGIADADPLARDSISSTKTLGIPIVTLVISPEAEIAREDPRLNVADITADGQAAHSLVIQYTIMKEDAVDAVEPRVSFKERVNIFVTKTANAVKNTGNRAKMYLIFNSVSSPNSHPARK